MGLVSWVDNRTLLLCLCILITVFSVMMLGLRSFYPALPGIRSVTAGFFLGLFATILLMAAGPLPFAVSAAAGSGAAMLSAIFLYRGILQFCRQQRTPRHGGLPQSRFAASPPLNLQPLLYAVIIVAEATVLYFTSFHRNAAACVIAITLALAFARYLMAWTLFRAAAGRRHLLAFASVMLVFAIAASLHALILLIQQPTTLADVWQHDHTQSVTLLLTTTLVCFQGIFYLMMFAGSIAETMEEQAQLDFVSGTINRRGVESALAAEIARTKRSGGRFAVLLIDIDHFKSVNDRFGHSAGDEALRRVAASINASIRIYDALGRFGGDEFLLLLPHTGSAGAMQTAERLRDAVRTDTQQPGSLALTLSIGITICSHPEPLKEILARADAALYQAKHAGRDCIRLNSAHTSHNTIESLALESLPTDAGAQASLV